MTLSDLGNLGEFISSVAVVFSLIYVALQVRQNSRETRLTSRQSVLESSRDMIARMATREITVLLTKAAKNRDSLDEAEVAQYRLVRMAQLRNIENAYLMRQDGVIDEDVFEIFAGRAREIKRSDPDIVETSSHTKAFREWIDQLEVST
jgi:hypothetical protein